MNPYKPDRLKILDIKKHTAIDYTYFIERDREVKGGDFYQVSVPRYGEVPISISDYGEDYVELTIRKVGHVTEGIFQKKVGDYLGIRGPYGNYFNLDDYRNKHLIVVAGGTGLAPVKSVINHFYRNPEEVASLKLILGFKSSKDILFREEIEAWMEKIDVTLTIDREEVGWQGEVGFVTDHIESLEALEPGKTKGIVVGPGPMIKYSALGLKKLGLEDKDISISLERHMSCGIGKCGHCKVDSSYVCVDGPIFTYDQGKKLID